MVLSNIEATSGKEIQAQLREGHPGLYQKLYERTKQIAKCILRSSDDCEDAAQLAVINAWKSSTIYDPNRNIYTWIEEIARNVCIDKIRKIKRTKEISYNKEINGKNEDGTTYEEVLSCENTEDRESLRETRERLLQTIERLPPKQRKIVKLRYLENRTINETHIAMRIPEGSVKSGLHSALNVLRKNLKE